MAAAERVVAAPGGALRGIAAAGVVRFLGVPYAEPPVGARRLRSPHAHRGWQGIRDALKAGPASLQVLKGNQTWLYEPLAHVAEDCLTLNIWAPDRAGAHPVMVWLHGGATRNGHGAAAAFDGTRLSAEQGIVVVTVNYRLGALGGLAHPALADPDTGQCANWGLQDKLLALEWVQHSIGAFGGDPRRVTLAGQSSGAANAVMIAQGGLARERVHRLIAQSPPLFRPPMFVELEAAAEYTELVAARLGVAVADLPAQDGVRLQAAEQALAASPELAVSLGRPRTAPVLDRRLLRAWPCDAAAAPMPVLAGWTRDEANFWFDLRDAEGRVLSPQLPPADGAELERRVASLIGLHHAFARSPGASSVLATYAASGSGPREAWNRIYTDLVFRAPIAQFLARQADAGQPTFGYEFARALPPPGAGAPHACEVPLVFGTGVAPHLVAKVGAGSADLSAWMRAAWGAFVRDGVPGAAWPAYSRARKDVMLLEDAPAPAVVRDADRLALWSGYAH